MAGSSTQMSFGAGGPQGLVVLGAAGGAAYAQRPSEYQRQRLGRDGQDGQRRHAGREHALRAVVRAARRPRAHLRQQRRAGQARRIRARGTAFMTAATLAISDGDDGRRVLALSGRLDADSIPTVWPDAVRALQGCGRAAGASSTAAASTTATAPAWRCSSTCCGSRIPRRSRSPIFGPAIDALLQAVRRQVVHAGPRPGAEAPTGHRGSGLHLRRHAARHARAAGVRRRGGGGAGVRRPASVVDPLARRRADLREGGRRRACRSSR